MRIRFKKFTVGLIVLVSTTKKGMAQNGIEAGKAALEQASADLKTYFSPVVSLVYVIAAIVGVWGAYRIYSKLQAGDQNVQNTAISWIGSFIFLLAAAAVLESIFL